MINAVMLLVVVTVVVPFLLLFMSSITDENTLLVNGYSFFPKGSVWGRMRTSSAPAIKFSVPTG